MTGVSGLAGKTLYDLRLAGKVAASLTGDEDFLLEQYDEESDEYLSLVCSINLLASFLGVGSVVIINALTETVTGKALDATQGKILKDLIDTKLNSSSYIQHFRGKYASLAALQSAIPTASDGDYAVVDTGSGDAAHQYLWDAQEGWVASGSVSGTTTDVITEGSTNKYFTEARALASVVGTLDTSSAADASPADSIKGVLGKLQAKWNAFASSVRGTVLTGISTSSSTDVTATDTVLIAIGKLQAKAAAVASNVLSTALTGLSTATNSAVVATDSVLVAIGKLQSQLANYLTVANSRYSFNAQTGTTYALASSDVTSNGRVIVRLSNAAFTNLTLPTPTSLGATTGDSVQVQITAAYSAQALVASGSTTEGILTFSKQWHTKTLIVKDANTWVVVG